MRAMILAAGLGTRLRPMTEALPKALVEISGRTLLEITLARLRSYGVHEVMINVHHMADTIVAYLDAHNHFGMHIEVSREEVLLDTGGGLKKAAWFFLEDPDRLNEPFILHNVDVLSTIDLGRMVQFHAENEPLVTLAVQEGQSSRCLLFDEQQRLCGRQMGAEPSARWVRSTSCTEALDFTGIHVISPRLFRLMTEEGAFSIIDTYVRLAAEGSKIIAFRTDEFSWRDVGNPESLAEARQEPLN